MGLTTPAIIVIVIVACLAAVSLGAALTRQLYPAESYERRFQPSHAQEMYMRSVRMRNLGIFRRESLFSSASVGMGKDLESRSNDKGVQFAPPVPPSWHPEKSSWQRPLIGPQTHVFRVWALTVGNRLVGGLSDTTQAIYDGAKRFAHACANARFSAPRGTRVTSFRCGGVPALPGGL
ncbi:uncharacterized protein NFIA_106570 [Aspergillus fischeri NRRL 181]|uniref:Uncharacterized protein n=1 Tax=Neosartorya fischeri (strain ATCC 1020 / DSM 3700 / CBS 544.65 / FGSC A1164 / JCM 1740 / NRRL 181 / WB 181) TaxID=331117 RepID=A1CX17_NEOFI|nr:conserved hypothetical protein [Aspergillus fischeri NRRL 181]EAW25169.1 conserved hypothetical protein [Aspergillus fischeri NRRL 181]